VYGIDLRDLWRPDGGTSRLTWRRLAVLVRKILTDPKTLTARALDLPEYSPTEFLLADLRWMASEDHLKNPWRVRQRSNRSDLAKHRAREFQQRKRQKRG
jgi:hypothetical protein